MPSQFHSGIDDLANEAEISDLRKKVSKIDDNSIINSELNDIKNLQNEINVKSLKEDVNDIKNSDEQKVKKNNNSKIIRK